MAILVKQLRGHGTDDGRRAFRQEGSSRLMRHLADQ
jgi:hypothetical protein